MDVRSPWAPGGPIVRRYNDYAVTIAYVKRWLPSVRYYYDGSPAAMGKLYVG